VTRCRQRILVSGLVQGVGFRAWTARTAADLGVLGTVRNLPAGQVEIYCEGEMETLQQFAALVNRGPSRARVTEVQCFDEPLAGDFSNFSVEQ
jgi:acylphosphatase